MAAAERVGRRARAAVVVVTALAAVLLTTPAQAGGGLLDDLRRQAAPRLVDLGVPGESTPVDINDDGVVVGSTVIGSRYHAFRWQDGDTVLLPDGGENSWALAVDGRGRVLGRSGLSAGLVLWNADGTHVEVTPTGATSWQGDVNEDGLAAATVHGPDGRELAMTWREGAVTWLPDLGAGSQALLVNERGDVAGTVVAPDGGRRAALWRDGALTVLPGPDGSVAEVSGLGGGGLVAGRLWEQGIGWRGVVWDDGRLEELTGDAQDDAVPGDVNGHDVVVGWYLDHESLRGRALVRDPRLGPVDLPTLGGRSAFARAVDDHGIVVGSAQRSGDVRLVHAVAWVLGVPVPLGERLPGAHVQGSEAYGLNERGQVIGVLNAGMPDTWVHGRRAVLWELDPRR